MSIKANTATKDTSNESKVLRVIQLDTSELDVELLNQSKQLLDDCFKYIQIKFLNKYKHEANLLIKCLIWHYTFNKTNQTIGQSIFNWSYKSNNSSKSISNTLIKYFHLLFYCFDYDTNENIGDFKLLNHLIEKLKMNSIFNAFLIIIKFMKLINYLLFLYNGNYLYLFERILRLKAIYSEEQELREVDDSTNEYTERELIWQSYFVLIKLLNSLFNLKTRFISRLLSIKQQKKEDDERDVENETDKIYKCKLCDDKSLTNCYKFKNCHLKHTYCYYCIKSNVLNYKVKSLCKYCSNDHVSNVYDCNIEAYFV